jgi:hypothetical protein
MEDGTPSEDHPQAHVFIREAKEIIRSEYPDVLFLCESDLPIEQMDTYVTPDECDACFNFKGRIDMMHALAKQDATPIETLLRAQKLLPLSLTRFNHDENHDDMRSQWEDSEVQDFMREHYGDGVRGEKYLSDAVVGCLWPLLDWDLDKVELIEAIRRIIPGGTMDYYRKFLGMGHHPTLAMGYGKSDDPRDGGRTPPHWDDSPNAGFSKAHPRNLYLPIVDEGRGDYRVVNYKAQLRNPRSPVNMRDRDNHLLLREPLLAFGHADVLPTRSREQLAVVRSWEGLARIGVGVHNLHPTRSTEIRTHLPNTEHFKRFRGATAVDLASGVHVTDLHGRDGLHLTVTLPPLGHWTLVLVPK